jgi:hypothetical protein
MLRHVRKQHAGDEEALAAAKSAGGTGCDGDDEYEEEGVESQLAVVVNTDAT